MPMNVSFSTTTRRATAPSRRDPSMRHALIGRVVHVHVVGRPADVGRALGVIDHDVGVRTRRDDALLRDRARTCAPASSRRVRSSATARSRRSRRPGKMRSMRCSTEPMPFGILEKSPSPSSFWSFMQNGQWSVDTTTEVVGAKCSPQSLVCFGAATKRRRTDEVRALESLAGEIVLRMRNRYCGQVSAKTFVPGPRAATTRSSASAADRCTM